MAKPAEMVQLLGMDPARLASEDLLAGLASAEELRSWIAARENKFIRALNDRPVEPSDPARDTADRVGREQNSGPGRAKTRTERAEQMKNLPETEQSLEDGHITDAHAEAMAKARAKADPQARAALEANEARLLEEGRKESPAAFAKRLERFVKNHSGDDGRSEWDKKRSRRRFRSRRNPDGTYTYSGEGDPEGGGIVDRVLRRIADELYRRDHQDHPADEPVPFAERTSEQRLFDALEEMARRADATTGPAPNQDRVVVTMDYDPLTHALGDRAVTPDGTPVPASVARRMACDAGIIPIVLGGRSVPLDLGRSARGASPAQRVATGELWATCSFADCTVPFAWTQIHHTRPFNQPPYGNTDLSELTPVCRSCHDKAHTPGWIFTKDPDDHSTTTIAPDGRTWHRRPNGNRQPDRQPDRPAEPPPAAAPDPGPDQAPAATLFTDAA